MATIEELKAEATELGLEFLAKATKPELEQLIADKKAETAETEPAENVESIVDSTGEQTDEATGETKENEQPETETEPEVQLNEDGFEVGKPVSEADYFRHIAEQRAKQ